MRGNIRYESHRANDRTWIGGGAYIYRSRRLNVSVVCIILLLRNCFRCLVNVDLSSRTTYKKPMPRVWAPRCYSLPSDIQLTSPVLQTQKIHKNGLITVSYDESYFYTHCQCDSVQPQCPGLSSFPMPHLAKCRQCCHRRAPHRA